MMASELPQGSAPDGRPALPPARPNRVFISYTHDSPAHQREILDLADRLRGDGVDCTIDQYEDSPAEGWPLWMARQIEASDFVLAVCTKSYYRRVMGEEQPGVGRGARWEGKLILEHMYEDGLNRKFIPVLTAAGDVADIPLPLRDATYYRLRQGGDYENLLRRLTGQPAISKPALGTVPSLRPRPQQARRPTLWNVPFHRNAFFTGRDSVIEAIAAGFRGGHGRENVQAISGMGGVGKTQTAVEYAYRHGDRYAAVFWIRAATAAELQSGFIEVARLLDLPEQNEEVIEEIVRGVRTWLRDHDDWLLVYDNADTPSLLVDYLPDSPRGHVLVTSRAATVDVLGVTDPIQLPLFSSEEALQFLFARTGRARTPGETSAAVRLVESLGGLPLALEQAGAFLAATSAPFAVYEASYETRRLAALERSTPVIGGYAASVATTWAMNVAELEETSPVAGDILRASAFLAPDSIPLDVLVAGAAELGPRVSVALASVQEDPALLYQALQPLSRFSLVQLDPEANAYSVHRLVQESVRAEMSEDGQRTWARRVVRALNIAFPMASFPNWPLCDQLIPHVKVAAELVARWGFSIDDAGHLLNEGASFLRMRADYTAAEAMHKQSLALAEAADPPDDQAISTRLNNLALVYIDQLRYDEAEPLLVRSLEIAEAAHDPDDSDLALPLNSLAGLYTRMGRFEAAAPLIDRALAVWSETNDEIFFTAVLLNTKAEVLIGLERHDEALEPAEESLRIREQVGNLEKTARSYQTLAYLYFKLGRHEPAARMFEKAIEAKEKVHGGEHAELVATFERHAEFLSAIDRNEEAAVARARAESIRQKLRT
jgi:tetratricopeptide (TPR) repeat protein